MTERKLNLLEFGILPRGMNRAEAAAYVGVSPDAFSRGVKKGLYPAATPGNSQIWDRKALDRHFDQNLPAGHTDPFKQRAGQLHGKD